jgi:predicted transcriptional regulator
MAIPGKSQPQSSPTEELRKAIKKTGQPLSALPNICGIRYPRFYRIAKGISDPTFDEALQIYKTLGFSFPLLS